MEQIKKLSLKSILKRLEKEKIISKGLYTQKEKKLTFSLKEIKKKINLNEKENLKSHTIRKDFIFPPPPVIPGGIKGGYRLYIFSSNVSPGAKATGSHIAYSKKAKNKRKFTPKKILKSLKIVNKNILLISLNLS